ncbi:MAG: hypothetical protein IPO92_17145 [Saprospiraceae bacterium]|nr:hypothetical protein [Saprospiraceae bacterium]
MFTPVLTASPVGIKAAKANTRQATARHLDNKTSKFPSRLRLDVSSLPKELQDENKNTPLNS